MDPSLLDLLKKITPEEETILAGNSSVDRSLYTSPGDFVVDCGKLLEKGKLIEIRPHTRFVHFPCTDIIMWKWSICAPVLLLISSTARKRLY